MKTIIIDLYFLIGKLHTHPDLTLHYRENERLYLRKCDRTWKTRALFKSTVNSCATILAAYNVAATKQTYQVRNKLNKPLSIITKGVYNSYLNFETLTIN